MNVTLITAIALLVAWVLLVFVAQVPSGYVHLLYAGAVVLFEARARAAHPRFALNEHNVGAVVDICRHLDGIALAIELAAARVPLLGVDGLRARPPFPASLAPKGPFLIRAGDEARELHHRHRRRGDLVGCRLDATLGVLARLAVGRIGSAQERTGLDPHEHARARIRFAELPRRGHALLERGLLLQIFEDGWEALHAPNIENVRLSRENRLKKRAW